MAKDGSNWLGKQLSGRYTVRRQLGAGGMGMVFLAHDRNLDTDVVVKVPHRSMLADEEFVKRFAHEVRSLVALSHPHVVKVMDVGECDDVPFAVMQYLPGGDLKGRQSGGGGATPQDPATLAGWLPEVAKALDFIHAQGYVHRDIKPDNILFDASGNAYVGDFGIAKALGKNLQRAATGRLTQEGVALGTPEYMAPEVVLGENYDGRADQYALAATVFEIVCGRPPFQGNTPAAVIVQATTKSPPRPSTLAPAVSGPAEHCLLKGLSRKPADRHADCTTFATELIRLLGKPAPSLAGVAARVGGGDSPPGDALLPTSRYAAELSDTDLGTPPAVPKEAQRDTPRNAETVRQAPPPIPPRNKTQKSQRDQTSKVKQPERGLAGPFGKPAATQPATPKPNAELEPPTVLPSSAELQRPPATVVPDAVSKPARPTQRKAAPPKREQRPVAKAASPPSSRPAPARNAESPRPAKRVAASPRRDAVEPSKRGVTGLVLKIVAALAIVGGMSFLLVWVLSSRAVVVARDGSGDYESISEALTHVKPGGRIEIRKGRYTEDVLDIDKPVTIVGTDRENVVVNVKGGVRIKHAGATLRELTIHGLRSGSTPAPAATKKAARHSRAMPVLPAAVLFQAGRKNGGDAEGGSSIFSTVDTKQKSTRAAIRVTNGTPSILNCVVTSDDGVGIIVEGSGTKPTIRDCRVHGCRGAGLYCINGASAVVEDCRFESNRGWGILVKNGGADIRKCRITDTRLLGKNQAFGIVIFEGTSWIEDCEIRNIATAIGLGEKADATIRGCRLSKGTSTGLLILGKATVTGKTDVTDFETGVIVGSKGNADFDDCRVHANERQGFLITGKARLTRCSVYAQKGNNKDLKTGRGIEISPRTGDAVISETKVYGNKRFGLAVFGKARIENRSDVYENTTHGVFVHESGSLTATKSSFRDGTAFGVHCQGKLEMTDCTVSGNKRGGLSIDDNGRGTLRNVTVDANKGTGVSVNGTGTLENCTITGNHFSGVYVGSGNAAVTGCRINANRSYGLYVGSRTEKNVTKYGAATITGGDLTKNAQASTRTVSSRASITMTGTVKTDSGTGK